MKPIADLFRERTNLNKYQIVHRGKGSIGYRTGRNQITYQCAIGPLHYLDGRMWRPITLKHSGGKFDGIPFGWNGEYVTYNDNMLFKPISITYKKKLHKLNLKPDYINNRLVDTIKGVGEYSITFTNNGVKENLFIPEPIEGLLEFDVRVGDYSGLHKSDRIIDNYGPIGDSVFLTKDMKYPINIDPAFYIDADCGLIYGQNATQSTARSTSTYGYMLDSHVSMGWYIQSPASNSLNYRGYVKFNTTDVGAGATVTQVNMYAYSWTNYNQDSSSNVYIVDHDWSSNDPITSGNRETVYDASRDNQENYYILGANSEFNGNNEIISDNLSTSWINKTGYTYYAMLDSDDYHSNDTSSTFSTAVMFTVGSTYLEIVGDGVGGTGWANIWKVNGTLSADIAKANAVDVASISKVNGIAV